MMATRKRLAAGHCGTAWPSHSSPESVVLVRQVFFGPNTITAYFPTATSIYPGDEVRVSGVKVGKIDSIKPEGTQTKMTLKVDHGVPVPADAKAVIVAQNLVAARYVQLTPAYRTGGGPTMRDGAVIPSDRTAVPVEWDEVKTQLMRLATELGPKTGVSGTSVSQVHRQRGERAGRQRRQATTDAGPTVRCRKDFRRRQRQHRRHHQEPADLRHRASRQQATDRHVREPAGQFDERRERQQVRSGRGVVGPVGCARRGAALRRGQSQPDCPSRSEAWPKSPRSWSTTARLSRTFFTSRRTRSPTTRTSTTRTSGG